MASAATAAHHAREKDRSGGVLPAHGSIWEDEGGRGYVDLGGGRGRCMRNGTCVGWVYTEGTFTESRFRGAASRGRPAHVFNWGWGGATVRPWLDPRGIHTLYTNGGCFPGARASMQL